MTASPHCIYAEDETGRGESTLDLQFWLELVAITIGDFQAELYELSQKGIGQSWVSVSIF